MIRQATTAPQFSTVLMDHLPASATAPTPLAHWRHYADNGNNRDMLRLGFALMRNVLKACCDRLGLGWPPAK